MKSFDIIFDDKGTAIIHNIQGVEGPECLNFTQPYVDKMQDKSDPAEVILEGSINILTPDETVDGY